jgi:hypothetical protein
MARLTDFQRQHILFLASLALILVGDAQLVRLPVEPRDFLIPELEGGSRLLERGMLPLELALCLLPRHAFSLEGSSGLLESRLLLLESSFRLLARALLLLELPLCRGERGIPLRQLDSQLLSLLGLLLGLALPRPCSLEGCAVLLELGSSRGDLCLPLRRHGPHRGQVLACLPQRLIPLQKHRPHLLDCGGVFRSLVPWFRSSSRTTCSRNSSHPLSVRRASTRASRASY